MIANTNCISSWKPKGLSDETIKLPATPDNSLTPELSYYDTTTRVKFTGRCLKQTTLSTLIKMHYVFTLFMNLVLLALTLMILC